MSPLPFRPIASLCLATIVLLLAGCGYYNPYLAPGNRPLTLHRSMWINHTTELGLDNTLFQAQADWLRKSPLITVSATAERADYSLTGAIERVNYPEISFGAFREGTEGRAELTVSFTLKDSKSGEIVWQKTSTRQQTFYMTQNPMQLQANRKAALQEIANDFAEEIYLLLIKHSMMRPSPSPVSQ